MLADSKRMRLRISVIRRICRFCGLVFNLSVAESPAAMGLARYANRSLCGAIFRPFVHLPGRLECARRQRRRGTVDHLDRLLS